MNEDDGVGTIQVPRYFSGVFGRKISAQDLAGKKTAMPVRRIQLLINDALANLPDSDWIISETEYHSLLVNEPYGIESDGVMTYIFSEERGEKSPIALFKDDHMAAKYFVWLVSKGKRTINWDLFLDLVP